MKENKGLKKMFGTALKMEEKGMVFYRHAMEACTNKLAIDIFKTLHDDEMIHISRIKKIHADIEAGRQFGEAWKTEKIEHADIGKIFKELAAEYGEVIGPATKDVEAVEVGLDFELKSVTFYMEWMSKTEDSSERCFLKAMVGEEQGHHRALVDLKFYLTDPTGWFNEHERSMWDGA